MGCYRGDGELGKEHQGAAEAVDRANALGPVRNLENARAAVERRPDVTDSARRFVDRGLVHEPQRRAADYFPAVVERVGGEGCRPGVDIGRESPWQRIAELDRGGAGWTDCPGGDE